jgi:hypothetical protein
MLRTIEAEIEVGGSIRLLEPIEVNKTTRAIVTLLDETIDVNESKGHAADVLKFLRANRLPKDAYPNADEIEAQISEARESWD